MKKITIALLLIMCFCLCIQNSFAEDYPWVEILKNSGIEVKNEEGHQFLGYVIADYAIAPVYYSRGSKKWGDRIGVKQGQLVEFLFEVPEFLDTKKVEAFYDSLRKEEKDEKANRDSRGYPGGTWLE